MSRPGWMWEHGTRYDLDAPERDAWLARRGNDPKLSSGQQGYTRFPTKAELRSGGADMVLRGWVPAEPLIRPGMKVLALGSCFAAHFIEWLAENGHEQSGSEDFLVLVRNPLENVAVIAQKIRRAFGEIDSDGLVWIDRSKQRNHATEEKRVAMRKALMEADVFIATISLSEIWCDKLTGEPLWRMMPQHLYDPERHVFKVLSSAENLEALETIERIRARWLPNLKILYTISPLPLAATFRPISPITASTASTAIVRGALDEFLRGRGDQLNRTYFYFPSYELVSSLFSEPFVADNRHLHDQVIEFVFEVFARYYTAGSSAAVTGDAQLSTWPAIPGQADLLYAVEQRNLELQKICDERLKVIEDLKRVCDERLALIERLHKSLNE